MTGNFYIYTTYKTWKGQLISSNSMYLIIPEGAVMFDTPWDSTQFQPLLDSIWIKHHKKPILCIATHFHEDRTAGLEFLRTKGVKTFATKRTDELSQQKNYKRAEFLMYQDSTFKVGRYSFQTYFAGEGHSPDNIVIWFEKEKILYGGCLIKSTEADDLGNLSDANVNEWDATITNIEHKFKNPLFIIPGHQDWTNKASLTHTLELVQEYKRKTK